MKRINNNNSWDVACFCMRNYVTRTLVQLHSSCSTYSYHQGTYPKHLQTLTSPSFGLLSNNDTHSVRYHNIYTHISPDVKLICLPRGTFSIVFCCERQTAHEILLSRKKNVRLESTKEKVDKLLSHTHTHMFTVHIYIASVVIFIQYSSSY